MKKKGILLFVLFVMVGMIASPLGVHASGLEITDSKGNTTTTDEEGNQVPVQCTKNSNGDTSTCYVAITVDEGDTISSFKFRATLTNLKYSGVRGMNSWNAEAVDNGDTVEYTVTKAEGLSGGKEVAVRMTFNVPNVGEDCNVTITPISNEQPQPTDTPKCKTDTDKEGNTKYYCENGAECTKEEYDQKCTTPTENPKTGSFMPYAVIIAGVAVAGGLYFLTKKNKIYHM